MDQSGQRKKNTARAAPWRALLLIALLAAVAIAGGQKPASAAGPFNPASSFAVTNANPGARASVLSIHSVPVGNQLIFALNMFVPPEWQVASGTTYPVDDTLGRVSMKVFQQDFVNGTCSGTEETFSGDLINDAIDPADPSPDQADWHATMGVWLLSFHVNADIDPITGLSTNWIIDVSPGTTMPFLICAPQEFKILICGSSASGKQVIANPATAGTYTPDEILSGTEGGGPIGLSQSVVIGADSDHDGLADTVDPSPNTPHPDPAAPSDSDCDHDSVGLTRIESGGGCPTGGIAQPDFRDCIETFVGTDPVARCAATPTGNDETFQAMPADLNDDQIINITDRTKMVLAVKNQIASPPVYNRRYDLNADGTINVTDRSIIVVYIRAGHGATCP